jgi:hypothetical protein
VKYYINTGYYSYYEPRSNVKAMLGITYKTRNQNEKHENKKTKRHEVFDLQSARQAILEPPVLPYIPAPELNNRHVNRFRQN